MEPEPFRLPPLSGAPAGDGWLEEVLEYRISPRPKSMFHTLLDARDLIPSEGRCTVRTRLRAEGPGPASPASGEEGYELVLETRLAGHRLRERLTCAIEGGLQARRLWRTLEEGEREASRREEVSFHRGPFRFPPASYPDVLLPFLLRGQPLDGRRRIAHSWTADRFIARVYYESRRRVRLELPAGPAEAVEVWLYPDLNDWIALGGLITRLVKPLLPRYSLWYEPERPRRLLRFEGAFGPPGAPEVVLEWLG
jgi:hypothetical protein